MIKKQRNVELQNPESPLSRNRDVMTIFKHHGKVDSTDISACLDTYEKVMQDLTQLRMKLSDFFIVKHIARGFAGNVYLVSHLVSKRLYAMKIMEKKTINRFNISALEECNVMTSANSPWLMQLRYAFQDSERLYVVMDYVPGKSLERHLQKTRSSEEVAKFYSAELVLAVEAFHALSYIHCDIHLGNVLLDANGHIRLIDYGACQKIEPKVHATWKDWQSVAKCIYIMLDAFSGGQGQCAEAKDLFSLLKNSKRSISCEQIKQHPWFNNKQWTFDTIRTVKAPIVPQLEDFFDGPVKDGGMGKDLEKFYSAGFNYIRPHRLPSFTDQLASIQMELSREDSEETEEKIISLQQTIFELEACVNVLRCETWTALSIIHSQQDTLKEEMAKVKKEEAVVVMKQKRTETKKTYESIQSEEKQDKVKPAQGSETKSILQSCPNEIQEASDDSEDRRTELEDLEDEGSFPTQIQTTCVQHLESETVSKTQAENKLSDVRNRKEVCDCCCHLNNTKKRRKTKEKEELKAKISHSSEDELWEHQRSGFIYYKGHKFVLRTYWAPRKCHLCIKLLWNLFKPYQAMKCRRCQIRCHKHHMDDGTEVFTSCSEESA